MFRPLNLFGIFISFVFLTIFSASATIGRHGHHMLIVLKRAALPRHMTWISMA